MTQPSFIIPTNSITSEKLDAKEQILAPIREQLKNIEVFGNRLLIGIYSPDTVGSGLLIKATTTKDEDVWQGTVGLVLAMGPGCFVDSEKWKFFRQHVSVGDWIVFRPSDGTLQQIGGSKCRLIQDYYVLEKITNPEIVS